MQMGYFGFHILFRANTDGRRNTFGGTVTEFTCVMQSDVAFMNHSFILEPVWEVGCTVFAN